MSLPTLGIDEICKLCYTDLDMIENPAIRTDQDTLWEIGRPQGTLAERRTQAREMMEGLIRTIFADPDNRVSLEDITIPDEYTDFAKDVIAKREGKESV